jgi:hypothetical protein
MKPVVKFAKFVVVLGVAAALSGCDNEDKCREAGGTYTRNGDQEICLVNKDGQINDVFKTSDAPASKPVAAPTKAPKVDDNPYKKLTVPVDGVKKFNETVGK